MNTLCKKFYAVLFLAVCMATGPLAAQQPFSNYDQLTQKLRSLQSQYPKLANLQSLAKTTAGRDVWMLTLGLGDISNHPAVAVIGGARGSHLTGSELALRFAGQLLQQSSSDDIQQLLAGTTFYIVPRLNPDASEQFFSDLKYERNANATPTDTDRDGAVNEDPYEDLNGDGFITMMRVEDPTGEWMPYSGDKRIMVKADITKAEKGRYLLYTEGRDNDKDGAFNEDGEGGVNLNKNFTFDYPYFTPGAGNTMLSEKENRGLLDFLFEKALNVFAVVSFGPANNLSKPVTFSPSKVSKRIITGWYKPDVAINKEVSELYKSSTGLKDAPESGGQPGDLFQWAYFHYGRLSFSTPGWWPPKVKTDSSAATKPGDNKEAQFLAWADQNNIDAFVDWQPVKHPDFPGRKVEVGGIKPFSETTPPAAEMDALATKHTDFIIKLAEMKPSVSLVNFKTEKAGKGLSRIKVDVYNSGILPTASKLGERTKWVRKVKVALKLKGNLALLSGDKQRMITSIDGDGHVSMNWLVRGTGDFSIEAGAPQAGYSTIEHTIK